jgi:hypothetical protein
LIDRAGCAEHLSMTTWQYRFYFYEPLRENTAVEDLTTLGNEGWEAVGLTAFGELGRRTQILLKRPGR